MNSDAALNHFDRIETKWDAAIGKTIRTCNASRRIRVGSDRCYQNQDAPNFERNHIFERPKAIYLPSGAYKFNFTCIYKNRASIILNSERIYLRSSADIHEIDPHFTPSIALLRHEEGNYRNAYSDIAKKTENLKLSLSPPESAGAASPPTFNLSDTSNYVRTRSTRRRT